MTEEQLIKQRDKLYIKLDEACNNYSHDTANDIRREISKINEKLAKLQKWKEDNGRMDTEILKTLRAVFKRRYSIMDIIALGLTINYILTDRAALGFILYMTMTLIICIIEDKIK